MSGHWNDFNDAQSNTNLIPKGTLAKVRLTIRPGGFDDPSQGWTGGYATRGSTGAVYLNGAETQISEALPKLIQAASDDELKDALSMHLDETRDPPPRGQARQKSLDLRPSKLARVTLAIGQNEAADPVAVCLLCSRAVPARAQAMANAFQQSQATSGFGLSSEMRNGNAR